MIKQLGYGAVLVVLACCPNVGSAQMVMVTVDDVKPFDVNGDEYLDEAELVRFYLRNIPNPSPVEISTAEDSADDVLTAECSPKCARLRLVDAVIVMQEIQRREAWAKQGKAKILWPGFGFSREVVDAVNARETKLKAPGVITYHRNFENDTSQFIGRGAVQLYQAGRNFHDVVLEITPGLDFELDLSKAANENSITVGVPIFATFFTRGDWLSAVTVGLTPKLLTDRTFDREVYEGTVSIAARSRPIAAGFIRPAPVRSAAGRLPKYGVYWVPSVQFEFGQVVDAGGNASLLAIAEDGLYTRFAPRAQILVFPNVVSERLRIQGSYIHRVDLQERWDRALGEVQTSYDLLFDGQLELTALYRRGRKPPAFTPIEELLLGIGVRF